MANNDPPLTYLDTNVFVWFFNRPKAMGGITLEEAQERQTIAKTLFEEAQRKERRIISSIYTKIEINFIDEEKTIRS